MRIGGYIGQLSQIYWEKFLEKTKQGDWVEIAVQSRRRQTEARLYPRYKRTFANTGSATPLIPPKARARWVAVGRPPCALPTIMSQCATYELSMRAHRGAGKHVTSSPCSHNEFEHHAVLHDVAILSTGIWRLHPSEPSLHSELWRPLLSRRNHLDGVCGVDREPSDQQADGKETANALDETRGALTAASPNTGA
jgi:hypothetical protein